MRDIQMLSVSYEQTKDTILSGSDCVNDFAVINMWIYGNDEGW